MADSIFAKELLSVDYRTAGSREEILNTADRLSVEIGLQTGRVDKIISGNRSTGIEQLDDFGTFVDALGVVRSKNGLEEIDSGIARAVNLTIGASAQEQRLYDRVDAALARMGEPPLL